jgi:hypothetical protein
MRPAHLYIATEVKFDMKYIWSVYEILPTKLTYDSLCWHSWFDQLQVAPLLDKNRI